MNARAPRGNVLILADDADPAGRLCRWVAAVGEEPVLVSGTDKQLFERGDDESIDLVITDLDAEVPASRTLLERLLRGELFFGVPQLHISREATLRERLHELPPDTAVVFLDSPAEAADFQGRVRLAVEVGRLRRELARVSIRDELTGAFNRRYLLMRLDQELSRTRRHRTPLSLILFDIDGLRTINDRFGLGAGDRAILHVSRLLETQVRKEDVHGRFSENTFAVLLSGTAYRGAAILAGKIRGEVEATAVELPGGESLHVHVSAGVAACHSARRTADAAQLLAAAERAVGEAKRRGGNRVHIDEALVRRERRIVLLADADPALLDPAEDLLALDDWRVIRAESASTLLETLRFRRPDLVILDLQLDQGRGADEPSLLETIHAMFADEPVPIIGLARSAEAGGVRAPARPRVDRYLTKPFSVSVLLALSRELIEQHAASARRPPV